MIRAISFDVDQTLWDFDTVMRRSLSIALDEIRCSVPGPRSAALTVQEMIRIRNDVADELFGRGPSIEEIRLVAFERTLETLGVDDRDLAVRLTDLYLRHRFDVELYPDVLPALNELRARRRLGVVSNGNTYLHACGLDGHFSFAIFATNHGVQKPDPRIFRLALEQAGCGPRHMAHVGDSLTDDVAGAQAAGIRAVWINRERVRNETDTVPDAEVHSLGALAHVLQDW